MFQGTTAPVNGVGTFSPDKTMSRAEFIQVVVKHLDENELTIMQRIYQDEPWYLPAYELAAEMGLIAKSEFSLKELVNPMSRQEMAMVLVRAAEVKGENMTNKITVETIADYETIAPQYRDYVRSAYKAGLIAGTDQKGTFAPHATLNRAQASMVLYRLVVPESRKPGVDKVVIETPTPENNKQNGVNHGAIEVAGPQTWREGEPHAVPKAGDTVIKKDGTKVVLKEYTLPTGRKIVGLFQGVDVATGVKGVNGATLEVGDAGWTDSSFLMRDPKTGEVYTQDQWVHISSIVDELNEKNVSGKDGEVRNTWCVYDGNIELWYFDGPI